VRGTKIAMFVNILLYLPEYVIYVCIYIMFTFHLLKNLKLY